MSLGPSLVQARGAPPCLVGLVIIIPLRDEDVGETHLTGALGESDGFVIAPHAVEELPAGAMVDAVVL